MPIESNYDKLPHHIIRDDMRNLSNQALRVVLVVADKTAGWHKSEDIISISQFMEFTSMSNRGVLNGIAEAIKKKVIARRPVNPAKIRQGFYYALVEETPYCDGYPCEQRSQAPREAECERRSQTKERKRKPRPPRQGAVPIRYEQPDVFGLRADRSTDAATRDLNNDLARRAAQGRFLDRKESNGHGAWAEDDEEERNGTRPVGLNPGRGGPGWRGRFRQINLQRRPVATRR